MRSRVPEGLEERAQAHLDPLGNRQPEAESVPPRPVVLIVEDDPGDRHLIARAFEDCRESVDVRFVETGEEAIDYLFRFGCYRSPGGAPRPSLVLLDLGMPDIEGRRILREIREDAVLRATPVVILTGSDDDLEVNRSYELGANSFFQKPDSLAGYRKIIRILEAYWLRQATLPTVEA